MASREGGCEARGPECRPESDPPAPTPHRRSGDAGGTRGQAEEAGAAPLILCHIMSWWWGGEGVV